MTTRTLRILAAASTALATAAAAGCTTSTPAPKAPLRAEQVVPAGMEKYALDQVVLHVTLPHAGAKKNASDLSKVVSSVQRAATGQPEISVGTTADSGHQDEPAAGEKPGDAMTATATDLEVSLRTSADVDPVTQAVTKAVRGTKVRADKRKALAFTLTVTGAQANGKDAAASLPDAAHAVIDPVLFGGYGLERAHTTPSAVTLTYVGSGVTPDGLRTVREALARAYRTPVGSVTAAPVS